jgi:NhaP-type Na+/H+ or K+/H+ antiporter
MIPLDVLLICIAGAVIGYILLRLRKISPAWERRVKIFYVLSIIVIFASIATRGPVSAWIAAVTALVFGLAAVIHFLIRRRANLQSTP